MLFLSQISAFFYSVVHLCSSKKSKFEIKTTIFRFNQKSLNGFTKKMKKVGKKLYFYQKYFYANT
jgi:hypothetical protein